MDRRRDLQDDRNRGRVARKEKKKWTPDILEMDLESENISLEKKKCDTGSATHEV